MKKRIKDIAIAMIILAIICAVFWNIDWISSRKEVGFFYLLLFIFIAIDIIIDAIKTKTGK